MKRILRLRETRTSCLSLALGLMLAGFAQAQPLALDAALVSSGGGAASASALQAELAAGEPVVGRATGGALHVDLGFFAAGALAGVGVEDGGAAEGFALDANYPNPFAPSTAISYTLPEMEDVRLEVFDVLGRRVRTLVEATQGPGRYTVTFTAESLASGVYLYRLTAGARTATRQMQLIR